MGSRDSVLALCLVSVLLSVAVATEPEVEQYLLPVSAQPSSRHPFFPQRTGQRTGIRQKKRIDEESSEQVGSGVARFRNGGGGTEDLTEQHFQF